MNSTKYFLIKQYKDIITSSTNGRRKTSYFILCGQDFSDTKKKYHRKASTISHKSVAPNLSKKFLDLTLEAQSIKALYIRSHQNEALILFYKKVPLKGGKGKLQDERIYLQTI